MRKNYGMLLVVIMTLVCFSATAQKKKELSEIKYRRSSLHTVLVQSGGYDMAEVIEGAFHKAPFPDKYNNHNVGMNTLNRADYPISDQEREEGGAKRTLGAELGNQLASEATNGITDPTAADVPFQIEKFITQTKLANKLVAKWWDIKEDGSYGVNLIYERGMYDASNLDAELAQGTTRGAESILQNAGLELIDKTFVVFNKMHFVENEKIAALARNTALKAAELLEEGMIKNAAIKAAETAYKLTREGYTVKTTSYLYKLNWNDSIQEVLYKELWIEPTDNDEVKTTRKKAFDDTNFQLTFVGKSKASSVVMPVNNPFTNKPSVPAKESLELATVRNIDKVYAKLQKEYDVFKPMTPIYSVDPITARVGMKEGLNGGEKFEVLEQSIDPKTQRTIYTRKGVIKVDKGLLWDNRTSVLASPEADKDQMSAEEIEKLVEQRLAGEPIKDDAKSEEKEISEAALLGATTFKGGGKKIYPGMLIRQLK